MELFTADASGHRAPAMIAGNGVLALGKFGNGLHIDGDGWVNAGAISQAADWTIAFWIRSDAVGGSPHRG